MKNKLLFLPFLLLHYAVSAQQPVPGDSSATLEEVQVRSFEQNRKQSQTAVNAIAIEFNNGDRNNKTALVSGFNTIAGVRMEERSPGSYRINIRGSSLRSPFGVRNVKVYWNDIPMTDPGGNTYFNQFAYNNFSWIEIFKGPAGSMYGAGTGGLIQMYNLGKWQQGVTAEYNIGSYNRHTLLTTVNFGQKENKNQLTYAHDEADGYRDQSAMRRDNFSWVSELKINDRQKLTASLLYTDLYYQTPGALTQTELNNNPRAARPAAGGFPSAINAKAAIFQQNLTAGFTNQYSFSKHWSNQTTLYGTFNQVKNAAIRNYERRLEPSAGGRTVFSYEKKINNESKVKYAAGAEIQAGWFNTRVSNNRNGQPDTVQTNDDIRFLVANFFIQGDWVINEHWFINTGISLNRSTVQFSRLTVYPVSTQKRIYRNELAPRMSLRRNFDKGFAVRTTISRGFSPPTIAELLPSTGVISTDLEAEYGWNYELTLIQSLLKNKLRLEATGFYFKLNKALVQRRDISGADFFINAGDTKQKGLELTADYFTRFPSKWLYYCNINAAWTLNQFRYGNFLRGSVDYSGKILPSVPARSLSVLADLQLKNGIYSNTTWFAASAIMLNDANTAKAEAYQLLGWRIGWRKTINKKYKWNFFAGGDNLLDGKYSLGNDINAAAGRYFNSAPGRNYYAGISFQWIKPSAPAAPPLK